MIDGELLFQVEDQLVTKRKGELAFAPRNVPHALYGKIVLRTNKFKAHDELSCDIGDKVEIMETRPMSKEKRWRVTRIVEKVK